MSTRIIDIGELGGKGPHFFVEERSITVLFEKFAIRILAEILKSESATLFVVLSGYRADFWEIEHKDRRAIGILGEILNGQLAVQFVI